MTQPASSPARLFLSPPDVGARERALVAEVFASNYVAPAGPMLERFERTFCDYTGLPHAVAVSSGTAALHLALHMLGLGPGDAVICPTLTFIGGVAPVCYAGAQPIFVDAEPASWGLDPALLESAFALARKQGLNVRAVIPADLYGQSCDIDEIGEVCEAEDVPILLDSAEAMGATIHGRHVGHGVMAVAFSFNGNKIITTSGGGMLASHDRALIERARGLATAARQPVAHYEHAEVGFNYRLSALAAAVGVGQLESLEAKVARRRAIFELYEQQLGDLPGFSFAPQAAHRRHTRWLSVALVEPARFGAGPGEIIAALDSANIEARPLWKPMHLQPVFKGAPRVGGAAAERLFAQGLCLPSGSGMSDDDVRRVCAVIARLCRPARRRLAVQGEASVRPSA